MDCGVLEESVQNHGATNVAVWLRNTCFPIRQLSKSTLSSGKGSRCAEWGSYSFRPDSSRSGVESHCLYDSVFAQRLVPFSMPDQLACAQFYKYYHGTTSAARYAKEACIVV